MGMLILALLVLGGLSTFFVWQVLTASPEREMPTSDNRPIDHEFED